MSGKRPGEGRSLAYRAWAQQFTAELPPCVVCGERPQERQCLGKFRTGHGEDGRSRWTISCTGTIAGARHLVRVTHADRAIARKVWSSIARPYSSSAGGSITASSGTT